MRLVALFPLSPGITKRQSCHHHREQQAALSSQHWEHAGLFSRAKHQLI
jgi:hypothetical protein